MAGIITRYPFKTWLGHQLAQLIEQASCVQRNPMPTTLLMHICAHVGTILHGCFCCFKFIVSTSVCLPLKERQREMTTTMTLITDWSVLIDQQTPSAFPERPNSLVAISCTIRLWWKIFMFYAPQQSERSVPLVTSTLLSASLVSLSSADPGPLCPDHS